MSAIEAAMFGVLGKDAERKTSGSGKQYLRLNLRVGDGDAAQWVNAMVFDPDAIAAADQMVKGSRVYLEGKLSLDEWTGQDGIKRHGLSVMAWHCRLSQIGRNKPRSQQQRSEKPEPAVSGREHAARSDYAPAGKAPPFDDSIPFAPEFR